MKLQCSCGAKYAFDVTPEMAQNPVRFICPQCGADSSAFVNELVRQELGLAAAAPVATPAPAAMPVAEPATPPAPAPGNRLRISHEEKPAAAAPAAEEAYQSKFCPKHRGVPATEKCVVCHKPICPQCMELFGYFCSPLCKNKADLKGLGVAEYAGQRFNKEADFWRKTGLIFGGIVAAIVLFFGLWIWYAWFGSVPHPYFTVPFSDQPAYSGRAEIVDQNQLVFLHGGTLARYDMKTKKAVWSLELVTPEQVKNLVKEQADAESRANANRSGDEYHPSASPPGEIERLAKMSLEGALLLRASGHNIWVGNEDKLTQYDWATGKVSREVNLPEPADALVEGDGELLALGEGSVTHISLATGDSRVEQFQGESGAGVVTTGDATANGGLPLVGSDNGHALNADKVATQAQNLTLPGRIALPALLGNAQHEQQLEAALNDNGQPSHRQAAAASAPPAENMELVPGANGFVEFSTKLLEQKIVTRTAMRDAPKKSALDGDLNASQTSEVANEVLNDMQRNRGGDTVEEDDSRYLVTVHLPGVTGVPDWTNEVTGPPQLFPLKTVNVIAAGKELIVLDQSNKKLWQTTLTYSVSAGDTGLPGQKSKFGEGPCVEHGDTLYVFDQAVLSAFDLATGNARWRLPSVGVVGLFFDDEGMVYVNTTTGNPDDIKYSRQIDINKTTQAVLTKVDPKNGKTLWSVTPGGYISYLSGKFIYTTQAYDKNPMDTPVLNDSLVDLEKPSFFRIARINPKNGRVMWEYYDPKDRVPFYLHFDGSTIELVFKRQVEVLKYLTF